MKSILKQLIMESVVSIRTSIPLRLGTFWVGVFVAALSVLSGVSGLVYSSPYSPMLVLGGILAIGMFIVLLSKPVWALYAALVLVLLPLGLIPASLHSMLNRTITVIAAGMWFIKLLRTHKKAAWTGSAIFMLFFLIWSSITLLWVERMDAGTTALQVYALRFVLFLFLIPNEITTKRDLDGLMKALSLSGWILMFSVINTLLREGYTSGARLKIFGENENAAGMLALVTMIGVVWQASQPSSKRLTLRSLTTAVFILLAFILVVMSGSRGSALSMIITFAVFWLWKPLRAWGKLAAFITLLALIFSPFIFTTLVERFTLVERRATLLGGREVLWRAAWHLIQDNPLGGVGIGNAPYISTRYLETHPNIVGVQSATIHNPILTIWSETAIPGIFLYLAVLVTALSSFGRQFLKFKKLGCNDIIPYFAILSAVTLGYIVSWFKGGGLESHFSYFLILALLTLPSVLDVTSFGVGSSVVELPASTE